MLRIAFLGTGMVAELHYQALQAVKEIELVGLYDSNRQRMQQRGLEWKIKAYDSQAELLADPTVEAVYVLTSTESHVNTALSCLAAGKHVFIEKPVSNRPTEIETLLEASRVSGRVVMPGHNYAYIQEFQRIARLVQQGNLGRIQALWINYAIKHSEQVASAYGGVLEEVMIHHTYLALSLLGKPDFLYAGITEPGWVKHEAEDQAWMTWVYPKGISANLFATFAVDDDSADPWTFVIKVLGTEGSASLTWRSSIFKRALGSLPFALPAYEESYERESRQFLDTIANGTPLVSTLEDALASAKILEAAYTAAKRQAAVHRYDSTKSTANW